MGAGEDSNSSEDFVPLQELTFVDTVPAPVSKLAEITNNLSRLPIHQLKNTLRALSCTKELSPLFQKHELQLPVIPQVKRDTTTGKLLSYKEVETSCIGQTAKNSLSLKRTPGPQKESLKGNSTNYPFWPGGFDEETEDIHDNLNNTEELGDFEELFSGELLTAPPSSFNGMTFESITENKTDSSLQQLDVKDDGVSLNFWKGKEKVEPEVGSNKLARKESSIKRFLQELPDTVTMPEILEQQQDEEKVPVLKISKTPSNTGIRSVLPWAEMVDVTKPMDDFDERVPQMAYNYDFKLDTFQQQAICRLEEHQNVFVAAHTSAGKTVVAEYAIALSVRHMTRTVYTSPIKALSNQKFRDFKKNFESVGLITGDVQINSSASCLIMTTEILRSMLYNGSDVIRDLEWVVFDEIHYLNNEERGHVWEEVLIMLPQHVSIIMLSATVPNALEFANWVGGIKKKKIYVITTPKRPVPLEHHLYTGSGGKSRNEQFLILDANGRFIKKGYSDAKAAKEGRMSKHQQSFGAKKGQKNVFNENSEKTTYVGLVAHLKENDKLPVVIFTFSRNRCDTYARLLSSTDLCTGAERAKIHGFVHETIQKLKEPDRRLPQVLTVSEMLKSGVGVHHSGILPILKEVVEMLFQKGLVKLLFATETFAMGVNMPARTVVFDSFRKHDGTCFRDLNPAEYIQMAGRAGRRGLDTTGTVILLCKQNVPDISDLETMMLGKAAKLASQFRLTYSMILNLLRVESLTVEEVMKRSFLEAGSQTLKVEDIKEKLKVVTDKLNLLEFEPMNDELSDCYVRIRKYLTLRSGLMSYQFNHSKVLKQLVIGRLVIFEKYPFYNSRVGVILQHMMTKTDGQSVRVFRILTLVSPADDKTVEQKGLSVSDWPDAKLLDETAEELDRQFQLYLYRAQCPQSLFEFQPDPMTTECPKHIILTVPAENILHIIDRVLRVDKVDIIFHDIKTRETPRFSAQPPGPTVDRLVRDLYDQTMRYANRIDTPNTFNAPYEITFEDAALMQKFMELYEREYECTKDSSQTGTQNFISDFKTVFCFMKLQDEKDRLKFLLSPNSLRLHEEYKARINVLRTLGYIDGENLVQLKGRVACEMGNQNELMVTEMVLNNVLSDCPPEEIAALLSCMVFETKNVPEPEFPEGFHLKQKIEDIKALARSIGMTQRDCQVSESVDAYVDQFKFGLVEVVYEWAKGKEFAEIMKLTEVQEGLIVRTIQRLDEMLRDVKDAARIIGDPSLKKKMEAASECIKRDIVFAASLYTQ